MGLVKQFKPTDIDRTPEGSSESTGQIQIPTRQRPFSFLLFVACMITVGRLLLLRFFGWATAFATIGLVGRLHVIVFFLRFGAPPKISRFLLPIHPFVLIIADFSFCPFLIIRKNNDRFLLWRNTRLTLLGFKHPLSKLFSQAGPEVVDP